MTLKGEKAGVNYSPVLTSESGVSEATIRVVMTHSKGGVKGGVAIMRGVVNRSVNSLPNELVTTVPVSERVRQLEEVNF